MKNISAFDIVCESIGFKNALKLISDCGGMVFYIPKLPSRDIDIALEVVTMKKQGYSKEQILAQIKANFEISHKTALKFYEKY